MALKPLGLYISKYSRKKSPHNTPSYPHPTDLLEGEVLAACLEGGLPDQHLVHDAAQGPQVGRVRQRLVVQHLEGGMQPFNT